MADNVDHRAIKHDTTHVERRGEVLDEVWWQGRQWAVTSYGIERRDGLYVIEADRLAQDPIPGVPFWPEQLAGKTDTDLPDFLTAYLVAVALHGVSVAPDGLKRAIENAMRKRKREVDYERRRG